MAYQIKAQTLPVGEEAVVKGTLGFSRWLTQLLDGEDLQKSIAAERQRGSQYPNMNVRCEAELLNPEVVLKDAQPNGTEKYVHERIFSKKDGTSCFRLERNKTLPKFGIRHQDGTIEEFNPEGKHFGEGKFTSQRALLTRVLAFRQSSLRMSLFTIRELVFRVASGQDFQRKKQPQHLHRQLLRPQHLHRLHQQLHSLHQQIHGLLRPQHLQQHHLMMASHLQQIALGTKSKGL